MVAVSTSTVYAISWSEMWRRAIQTKKDTAAGVLTPQEEKDQIEAAWNEMRREQTAAGVPIMGQTLVSGQYPAVFLSPGSQAVLQFVFVSTDTGMPVTGPEVGYVVYQVNLDPNFPDTLNWVGVSSDPAARFAFPVPVQGFEPSYFATPFDRAGRPIIMNGLDGDNVAVGIGTVIFPAPAASHQ
jgi:hypothetical protein